MKKVPVVHFTRVEEPKQLFFALTRSLHALLEPKPLRRCGSATLLLAEAWNKSIPPSPPPRASYAVITQFIAAF